MYRSKKNWSGAGWYAESLAGLLFDSFSAKNRTEKKNIFSWKEYRGFGPKLDTEIRYQNWRAFFVAGQTVETGTLFLPTYLEQESLQKGRTFLSCDPSIESDSFLSPFAKQCKPPVSKDAMVSLEYNLGYNTTVGTSGIYRKQTRLYEDEEINLIFDESGEQIIGALNGDTSQSVLRVTTSDESFVRYLGFNVYANGYLTKRAQVLTSYTLSQTTGTKDELTGTQFTPFLNNARESRFAEGPLPWDHRHVVKFQGSYFLKSNVSLGVRYLFMSGGPFDQFIETQPGVFIRKSPRGFSPGVDLNDPSDDRELRLRPLHQLDIRAQYTFRRTRLDDLILSFDVFNVLNRKTPLSVVQLAGETFGAPLEIQNPTEIQIGVRYLF